MRAFSNHKYPGLQDKLAWYYNEYVARTKAANKKDLYRKGVSRRLRRRFPGFAKLYRFRNDLSHGVLNPSAESLAEAQRLRKQAKRVVEALYAIAARRGHVVPPSIDYYRAIGMPRPFTPSNVGLQPTTGTQP
jgi:hypothetical protein